MNRWVQDFKPFTLQELGTVDQKVKEGAEGLNVPLWVARLLTVGMLAATYERLGKPAGAALAALAAANLQEEHVYGRRAPGGALAQVAHVQDVLPFNKLARATLRYAARHTAEHVAGLADDTRKALRLTLIRGKMEGMSSKALAEHLRQQFAGLKHDWRRIVVTESAQAVTAGYLLSQGEGQLVVGQSRPDCCPWCRDLIHGKVFTVTHTPPSDPSDSRWATTVWPGKINFGRSRYPRSREGKVRTSSELWCACIPNHPFCRCTFSAYNPRLHVLDAEGRLRAREG